MNVTADNLLPGMWLLMT